MQEKKKKSPVIRVFLLIHRRQISRTVQKVLRLRRPLFLYFTLLSFNFVLKLTAPDIDDNVFYFMNCSILLTVRHASRRHHNQHRRWKGDRKISNSKGWVIGSLTLRRAFIGKVSCFTKNTTCVTSKTLNWMDTRDRFKSLVFPTVQRAWRGKL